jgi:hypothetical protein
MGFANCRRWFRASDFDRDPYAVLGVPRGCSEKELKAVYRKLALRFHPDTSSIPRSDMQLKEVNQAYEEVVRRRAAAASSSNNKFTRASDKFRTQQQPPPGSSRYQRRPHGGDQERPGETYTAAEHVGGRGYGIGLGPALAFAVLSYTLVTVTGILSSRTTSLPRGGSLLRPAEVPLNRPSPEPLAQRPVAAAASSQQPAAMQQPASRSQK